MISAEQSSVIQIWCVITSIEPLNEEQTMILEHCQGHEPSKIRIKICNVKIFIIFMIILIEF